MLTIPVYDRAAVRARLGETWFVFAVGLGLVGLWRGAQATSELVSILTMTGAVGGG